MTKDSEERPSSSEFDLESSQVDEQGRVQKDVDQWAGLVVHEDTEELAGVFRLTEIDPTFECTQPGADPAANGGYLGLHFEAETFPGLAERPAGLDQLFISPHYFWLENESGTKEAESLGNSFACIADDERLRGPLFANEKASGWVIFDTGLTRGTINLDSAAIGLPAEGAWSWQF